MTLSIQDIVEVRAQITPRGAGGREFGRTMLLTTDPTLDAGAGRVRVFASMDEVARTFTPGSGSYQAAQGLLLSGSLSPEPGDRPLDQHEGVG